MRICKERYDGFRWGYLATAVVLLTVAAGYCAVDGEAGVERLDDMGGVLAEDGRAELMLNGEWGFRPVFSPAVLTTPPTEGWQLVELDVERPWRVPTWRRYKIDWGDRSASEAHAAWYRKAIFVPKNWQNKRVVLCFSAVHLGSELYVNGRCVGHHHDGFLPFEVDVTEEIRFGDVNVVALGVEDYSSSAAFTGAPVAYPIGKMYRYHAGIYGKVYLRVLPYAHVDDVTIVTSVREGTLGVEVQAANSSMFVKDIAVEASVWDGGRKVFDLPRQEATVIPQGREALHWERDWDDARLWGLDDPHLYDLETRVYEDGELVDRLWERFGFREFWIDGKDFVLNGTKIRLKGTWGHTGEYYYTRMLTEEGRKTISLVELYELFKSYHVNIVRLHAQVYPEEFVAAADEAGILVVDESAVMHRPLSDVSFEHVQGMIERDKNHPSVVIWSSSNEFQHWVNPRNPDADAFLYELECRMREADSTRPVMAHGYGNLHPEAMIDNIHYPESSRNLNALPNGLYWPTRQEYQTYNYAYCDIFDWDEGKPLVIGEHLIHESQGQHLVEDAYFGLDPDAEEANEMVRESYHELYRWAANLYRLQGVGYFSAMAFGNKQVPNPLLASFERTFGPYGVFYVDWPGHYYAGEMIQEEWACYNESEQEQAVYIQVDMNGQRYLGSKRFSFVLEPTEVRRFTVSFEAPLVSEKAGVTLTAMMTVGGDCVAIESKELTIYPRVETLDKARDGADDVPMFLTVGVDEQMMSALDELGVECRAWTGDMKMLGDGAEAVLAGRDCGEAFWSDHAEALGAYVHGGGTVIALEQGSTYWLPINVETNVAKGLNSVSSAQTRWRGHPLLAGIDADELRYWRHNGMVVDTPIYLPQSGNFRIVSDAAQGRQAALLEIPYGQGRYVLSQFNLSDNVGREPVADILLANLADYAGAVEPTEYKSVAGCVSAGLAQRLLSLGFRGAIIDGAQVDANTWKEMEQADVLMVDGQSLEAMAEEDMAALLDWVRRGGRLYLQGLTSVHDGFFAAAGVECQIEPVKGKVIFEMGNGQIAAGLGCGDIADVKATVTHVLGCEEASEVETVIGPGIFTVIRCGAGDIWINQLDWSSEDKAIASAERLGTQVMNALGCRLRTITLYDRQGMVWEPIDLRAYGNAPFGYLPRDERGLPILDYGDYDLSKLPGGRQVFAGIPFDVPNGAGRRLTAVMSRFDYKGEQASGLELTEIPGEVTGIAVGRYAVELAFLHTYTRNHYYKRYNDRVIGYYVLRYEDGSERTIMLERDVNVGHCSLRLFDMDKACLAWSHALPNQAVFVYQYRNPQPELRIESIDFRASGMSSSSPLLIAVSVRGGAMLDGDDSSL